MDGGVAAAPPTVTVSECEAALARLRLDDIAAKQMHALA